MTQRNEKKGRSFLEDMRLVGKALAMVWSLDWVFVVSSFLASLVQALMPYLEIYFSARLVEELLAGRDVEKLLFYVALLAGSHFLLELLRSKCSAVCSARWGKIGRGQEMLLNEKVLTMDYEYVESVEIQNRKKRIEEYQNIFGGDLCAIFGHCQEIFWALVKIPLSLWLIRELFLIWPQRGYAGLAFFAASPISSVCMVIYVLLTAKWMMRISEKIVEVEFSENEKEVALTRVMDYYTHTYIQDYKTGKDIRLFAQNELIGQEMDRAKAAFHGILQRVTETVGRYNGLRAALNGLMTGLVYLLLGMKTMLGNLTIGNVVQYAGCVQELASAITALGEGLGFVRKKTEIHGMMLDFLNIPSVKYQGTIPVEKRRDNRYEVEFKNVTFRYPDTQVNVLENLSCRFVISEKMAVVGKNGSGKTTFIKLLCRLYDPTEGTILLNGIDIRKYDYEEYLGLFSVVFQDFKIFGFELGENIAAGVSYDEDRVWDCIRRAGLSDCAAKLKDGLKTPLSKDFSGEGVEVSGGEAQKIAMARALYRDAPFVILDEPTAALDPIAEAEVYANFSRLVGNKTAVYISHRLSSCRFCDEILVFDQGKVVQQGDHETLAADADGLYYKLWQAQAKYYH